MSVSIFDDVVVCLDLKRPLSSASVPIPMALYDRLLTIAANIVRRAHGYRARETADPSRARVIILCCWNLGSPDTGGLLATCLMLFERHRTISYSTPTLYFENTGQNQTSTLQHQSRHHVQRHDLRSREHIRNTAT